MFHVKHFLFFYGDFDQNTKILALAHAKKTDFVIKNEHTFLGIYF